jgi:3-isopropylmalate/(R)-2-methylmalate dehydratase large subunit
MTITEKILARHAGKKNVTAGDNIWVDADILMTHDVCGPGTIGIFQSHFGKHAKVWDREKVVIIPDHYIFTQDPHAKRNVEILRKFASEEELPHYYDVGTEQYKGVCHVTLAEEGFNVPGSVIFGTDSHTCTAGAFGLFATGIGNTDGAYIMGTGKLWVKVPQTMHFIVDETLPEYVMAKDVILRIIGDIGFDGATYRAMEFSGEGIHCMNMEERMTLCNMVIEAGAKNGVIAVDQTTNDFLQSRTDRTFESVESDANSVYF